MFITLSSLICIFISLNAIIPVLKNELNIDNLASIFGEFI